MFGGVDWTELLSLLLVCITILGAVSAYLKQSEKNQKREHEQELMKVRLYTDRDIKTAQIETSSLMQGFNEPDGEADTMQELIKFASENPQIVEAFKQKLIKE